MSDARQHLRAVPAITAPVTTRHEIAVRFTSTYGLIVPLRKPLNSFRWVGPGTLRVSEQGILVSAKRSTLLGPRHTQRFVPAAEIRDVYREANAVQVHLRGARNPYFRMWAEDNAAAAQLVALLPTRHTIEFESEFHEPGVRSAWRLPVLWLLVLLALATVGAFVWLARHRDETQRSVAVHPQVKAPQPVPSPETGATRADALLAEQDLTLIGARIEILTTEFATALDALMDGRVSQQKFAEELERWLLPQWDALEAKVRRANAVPGSRHAYADGELMAAINNWQLALRAYTEDLRNQRQVVRTFEYLRRAELHEVRAQEMQRDLERQPP